MEHDKYIEWMSAALDGELSAGERRELDAHLAECPECAALFRELSEQSAALRSLDCGAPEDLRDRIMAGLPAEEPPAPIHELKQRPRTESGRRRWAGLAACAALVIAIGGAAALHGLGTSPAPGPRGVYAAPSGEPLLIVETPGDLAPEPDHYAFENEQIVRVCRGATPEAPSARIIGGAEELAAFAALFPEDDLSAVTGAYGGSFFEENRLLAVVVEEPSGSIRHALDPEGLTLERVTVLREAPEEITDDNASWLILAEVGPEFDGGDTLEVVFTG